jgi:hypothetical protein
MRIKILDFNPAGWCTRPLLFEWGDLDMEEGEHGLHSQDQVKISSQSSCPFRIVEDSTHIQSGAANIFGVPIDTVNMPGMSWSDVIASLEKNVREQSLE